MFRLALAIFFLGFFTGCREASPPGSKAIEPKLTRYHLTVPGNFETEAFSPDHAHWKSSLPRNLGYSETGISTRDFLNTNLTFTADGEPSEYSVYVSRKEPRLILIPGIQILISFDQKIVGTMGTGGISRHLTNDGKFAIIIHPSGSGDFFGVHLGAPKTGSPKPEFEGDYSVVFLQ